MKQLLVTSRHDTKGLRRFITMLLKSHTVVDIKKLNYVSNYCLHQNKIIKTQEKLLILIYPEHTQEKLDKFLSKEEHIMIIQK